MTTQDRASLVESGLQTVADAAKFLNVSRSHVYGLMDSGSLPYVKLGKSRRIPKQAVLNLAAGNLVVRACS